MSTRNSIALALAAAGLIRALQVAGLELSLWECAAIGLVVGVASLAEWGSRRALERRAAARALAALDEAQRNVRRLTRPSADTWTTCQFCGASYNTSATSRCPHCLQPAHHGVVLWHPDRESR